MNLRRLAAAAAVAALSLPACRNGSSSNCSGAAPVAIAGPDRAATQHVAVELVGSSSGARGEAAYTWRLESIPAGSAVALTGETTSRAGFTPDLPGVYAVSLVVSDGCGTSAPDLVFVTVPDPDAGLPPGCSGVPRPVANAGGDVTLSYYGSIYLSGSASTASRVPLSYRWTLTTLPEGSNGRLENATTVSPTLWTDRTGAYVVTLVVNDGCRDSAPDTAQVTLANHAPTVYTYSVSGPVPVRVPFTLQASGYDPDYYDALTFKWTVESAPASSTAVVSSATAQPTFTPDVEGNYLLSVVASDGRASSTPATVAFTAADLPPVANAGADRAARVAETVKLDGTASSDPNRSPLGFAWTLSAPSGSAATLSATNVAQPTFVPDVTGTYVAELVVDDGKLTAKDRVAIAVWPTVTRLAYEVVDAEYSSALDRLVLVAADPNRLYVRDPRTGQEQAVALGLVPTSVSVGPTGKFAAVGHAKAVSYVDLEAGTVVETLSVSATDFLGDVGDVALGEGYVYVIPRGIGSSDRMRVVAVELATGKEAGVASTQTAPGRARISPLVGGLYVAPGSSQYYGGGMLERYDLSAGTPVLATSATSSYGCADLWLSEAGDRVFTRCGGVFRASSSSSLDLGAAGSLVPPPTSPYGSSSLTVRHLADSATAGELSAVTSEDGYSYSADDLRLRRWRADGLAPLESVPFPPETVNGVNYPWAGRFVFYRSDGSERYVILRLAAAAGALEDFGIATF